MKTKVFFALLGLSITMNAHAGLSPVAIIEDINAKESTLSFMDYVNEGQVIKLGTSGKLVIGYLNSCQRETITGGTVTIGAEKSKVSKGQLLSEDVECDGGNASLSGQQAATSGALAFRGTTKSKIGIRKPDLTIYGTAPVVRTKNIGAEISIERVDKKGKTHTYRLKGKHIDLADKKLSLSLGGTYRIEVKGGDSKTFLVDKYAESGKISVVSRLIDL